MKINLPNVTLVAADCTDKIMKTIESMNISSEGIRYGETILFSHKKPDIMPSYFRFEKIPKIENLAYTSYICYYICRGDEVQKVTHGRGYVYSLQYHIVWCVKYRHKILKGKSKKNLKSYCIK
jgi:hypothetical protein